MGVLVELAIETAMRLGEMCSITWGDVNISERYVHLRHEAATRLAGKLSNVLELAAVTGHRDLRLLQRYFHPDPSDLARKIG